jgi:hypothetical protein
MEGMRARVMAPLVMELVVQRRERRDQQLKNGGWMIFGEWNSRGWRDL